MIVMIACEGIYFNLWKAIHKRFAFKKCVLLLFKLFTFSNNILFYSSRSIFKISMSSKICITEICFIDFSYF